MIQTLIICGTILLVVLIAALVFRVWINYKNPYEEVLVNQENWIDDKGVAYKVVRHYERRYKNGKVKKYSEDYYV